MLFSATLVALPKLSPFQSNRTPEAWRPDPRSVSRRNTPDEHFGLGAPVAASVKSRHRRPQNTTRSRKDCSSSLVDGHANLSINDLGINECVASASRHQIQDDAATRRSF
jgi:hypothetical protein